MVSSEQIRAARALIRWEQRELAEASGVSLPSIKRLEGQPGALAAQARTVDALKSALESAGVIFVEENGEGPGVRLRKRNFPMTSSEIAKAFAAKITRYCKDTSSMALASASGSIILMQYRRSNIDKEYNIMHFTATESGFDFEGSILTGNEMWNIAKERADAYPQHYA